MKISVNTFKKQENRWIQNPTNDANKLKPRRNLSFVHFLPNLFFLTCLFFSHLKNFLAKVCAKIFLHMLEQFCEDVLWIDLLSLCNLIIWIIVFQMIQIIRVFVAQTFERKFLDDSIYQSVLRLKVCSNTVEHRTVQRAFAREFHENCSTAFQSCSAAFQSQLSKVVLGGSCPGGSCPGWQLSWVAVVLGGDCPGWQLS